MNYVNRTLYGGAMAQEGLLCTSSLAKLGV